MWGYPNGTQPLTLIGKFSLLRAIESYSKSGGLNLPKLRCAYGQVRVKGPLAVGGVLPGRSKSETAGVGGRVFVFAGPGPEAEPRPASQHYSPRAEVL